MTAAAQFPPAVTFKTGAALLIELGIVEHITHQGVRHIAETHAAWPFGSGREHQYWTLANATVMATEPFLRFFRMDWRESNSDGSPP